MHGRRLGQSDESLDARDSNCEATVSDTGTERASRDGPEIVVSLRVDDSAGEISSLIEVCKEVVEDWMRLSIRKIMQEFDVLNDSVKLSTRDPICFIFSRDSLRSAELICVIFPKFNPSTVKRSGSRAFNSR